MVKPVRNTFTLREMAEEIGRLDRRDADSVDNLHQQLRGLHQRRLFGAVAVPSGRAKAAVFDLPTFCAVRLLMVLSDLGFDARTLREAHDFMLKSYVPLHPRSGKVPVTDLDAAIEGIERGEHWTLAIELRRHWSTGKRYRTGGFRSDEELPNAEVKRILDAQGVVQATVTIPATDLLKPLLAGRTDT